MPIECQIGTASVPKIPHSS